MRIAYRPPPPPPPPARVDIRSTTVGATALNPLAVPLPPLQNFAALSAAAPVTAVNPNAPTFRQLPGVSGLVTAQQQQAWRPDYSKQYFGITIDAARAHDVGYMKEVMQKVALGKGEPPPTQADYDYWIPKMMTIGDSGVSDYWLHKMIDPPDPNAPMGQYEEGSELWPEIRDIMSRFDDETATQMIAELLAKKGKKKSADKADASGQGAAAGGGDAGAGAAGGAAK